jgi:hypothetical protein
MINGTNTSWIPDWDSGNCSQYNSWKNGLDNLTGYVQNISNYGLLEDGVRGAIFNHLFTVLVA